MRITFRAIRVDNMLWNGDKCNTNQSKDKIYITLTIYNGRKESEKRVERMKDRENEINGEFFFLLGGTYYRGWETIL